MNSFKTKISFIIIGKNEGKRIFYAIRSVHKTIQANCIKNYEIIYVDSDSSDDSIKYAKQFDDVYSVCLKGKVNAAVARNEGAKIANGAVLFFIDGDMEIESKFFSCAFDDKNQLIHPFLSGDFYSIEKGDNGKEDIEYKFFNLSKDTYFSTTGGIFLIDANLWFEIGGMRSKYRRSQDIDFGMRLSKKGIKLLRKKEVIARHYTIFYNSKERIWKDLFALNLLYHKSVIYRDHFLNRAVLKPLSREISLLSLVFFMALALTMSNPFYLLGYPGLVLFKVIYKGQNSISTNFVKSFTYYALLDILVLLGLLLFWPSSNKNYTVKVIER